MAQAGLTARRTCRAGAKAEHSEPTVGIRRRGRPTDKSYSGDNRLVPPESPYRRRCSAPRCRLDLSWGWRRSQGFGCSPIKRSRELGSDRSGAEIVSAFERTESSEQGRISVYAKDSTDLSRRSFYRKVDEKKLTHIGGILIYTQAERDFQPVVC